MLPRLGTMKPELMQCKLISILSLLQKQGYLDEANVLGIGVEAHPANHTC